MLPAYTSVAWEIHRAGLFSRSRIDHAYGRHRFALTCLVLPDHFCSVGLNSIFKIHCAASNGDSRLQHHIFYWIGAQAQLDKKVAAAMHAVNLRNFLGRGRTHREEQHDESENFMRIFNYDIEFLSGAPVVCCSQPMHDKDSPKIGL
jgi:hypothetical protein